MFSIKPVFLNHSPGTGAPRSCRHQCGSGSHVPNRAAMEDLLSLWLGLGPKTGPAPPCRAAETRPQFWVHKWRLVGFNPDEIKVKIEDDKVTVHAHREKGEGDNVDIYDARRSVDIPANVKTDFIKCRMTVGNVLVLTGPLETPKKEKYSKEVPVESPETLSLQKTEANNGESEEQSGLQGSASDDDICSKGLDGAVTDYFSKGDHVTLTSEMTRDGARPGITEDGDNNGDDITNPPETGDEKAVPSQSTDDDDDTDPGNDSPVNKVSDVTGITHYIVDTPDSSDDGSDYEIIKNDDSNENLNENQEAKGAREEDDDRQSQQKEKHQSLKPHTSKPEDFEFTVDLGSFGNHDVQVLNKEGSLVIKAKKVREEGGARVEEYYVSTHVIPEGVEGQSIKCKTDGDNKLVFTGRKML